MKGDEWFFIWILLAIIVIQTFFSNGGGEQAYTTPENCLYKGHILSFAEDEQGNMTKLICYEEK